MLNDILKATKQWLFLLFFRLLGIISGLVIVAIAIPFRKEGVSLSDGRKIVNLPKWAWLWGNDFDGLLGDKRGWWEEKDRKSTRLNSSHVRNSYAVFCLKKKMINALVSKTIDENHIQDQGLLNVLLTAKNTEGTIILRDESNKRFKTLLIFINNHDNQTQTFRLHRRVLNELEF